MTTASTADSWNPEQYDRFKAERSQPFFDLVALLPSAAAAAPGPGPRVVDLGCGTGELTATLVDRRQAREVLGLDNAEAMLAEARGRASGPLHFDHGDIASFLQPASWDVIVSNAALQWVPDHPGVLARWVASLRPDGYLAVQVPANADHPAHLVADELAHTEPFRSAFPSEPPGDPVADNVLAPARYAELLHDLGLGAPHVRLQVYSHLLASSAEVVEWVKGTTLNRFKATLPSDLFDEFVARYRRRLVVELGDRRPYLYPFKRILFCGQLSTAGTLEA